MYNSYVVSVNNSYEVGDKKVFLYALKSPDGLIKVGRAIDPARRVGVLQTAVPGKLRLVHTEKIAEGFGVKTEAFVHWLLRTSRVSGAWFRISEREAIEAVSSAIDAVAKGEKPGRRGIVGRKKQWAEDMQARFAGGTFERIAPLLGPGEDRTDFVREAVDREIKRRERRQPTARPAEPAGSEGDEEKMPRAG